jgi:rare lipoprotein A
MKRLGAALFLGFLVSSFCPAQTQTGNASFNPSKTGFAISHSSLSFNTRVRVTNLRNGRSVEAVVNGRIPITSERIADISREAGAALGMEPSGLTLVEIEVISIHAGETAAAAPVPAAPEPQPPAPPQVQPSPPAQGQASSSSASREQTSSVSQAPAQILPIQTVTDIQYVPVPGPAQSNCCTPLLWVVLLLLLLVVIFLTVILVLILRRLFLWPWHYPVWYRRHLLYAKRRRRETAP